jgi:hypothetical protein
MTIRSGRTTLVDHIYKDIWKTTSAYHVYKDMWQTTSEDHVNKYTWHNQMMTSVNRKLVHAMSKSDVSKLHHSVRFTLGVSPPTNVKSLEVSKDEVLKSLSTIDMRYISGFRTNVRSRRRTCAT